MSEFQLLNVAMLHALWLVPALAGVMLYAARQRKFALRRFIEHGLLARLGASSRADPAQRALKGCLLLAALAFLVVALARPAWDPVQEEVTQRGRDVVFLLDVSRSMLAEDLPPTRLERAKLAIHDAVDRLEGDRVALAVFAGATVVKCPLTLDYGFFRMVLDDILQESVARGGTLIGDALRTVLRDVFDGKRGNYRDIVLITDGEDHESFPLEAAAEAGSLGVRLIAVGLGDERVGQRIPVPAPETAAGRRFLRHEGREVWTRLDSDTLRKMADATPGGRYLNVATGTIDLGEVYRRLIGSAEGQEVGTRTLERLDEKFQIFLAVCLLLLALEMLLRDRRRPSAAGGIAVLLLGAAWAPASAEAASVRGLVNEGNDAYRSEDYDRALRSYDQALEQDPASPYVSLNRANALYRNGDYAAAVEAYGQAVRQSLARNAPALEAASLHNLGNALFKQAEQAVPADPRQALDRLVQSARSYAEALRIDPRQAASAHNLEIARRLIRQLQEQAQQQPQAGGQPQEDGDSEAQDQADRNEALRQAAEEQQELADESEALERERQERRDADSRKGQRQRAQDLADRQRELRERTEQLAEDASPDAQGNLQEAARHQREAQRELASERAGAAEREQRQAADAIRRAAGGQEADGQAADASEASDADAQEPGAQAPAGQEQELTAEQILAKEQLDRRRRQWLRRVEAVPVEKDW